MKKMAVIGIAVLSVGSLLLTPDNAEARRRYCRPHVYVHRTYVPVYSYYAPRVYAPAYSSYDYDDAPGYYGYSTYYGYRPRPAVRVYVPRPYMRYYYGGRGRHVRPHASVRIGW